MEGSRRLSNGNGAVPAGVEVALDQIFEMRVPFSAIGAQESSRIRLRFSIWREHLPVDSLRWRDGSTCTRWPKRS